MTKRFLNANDVAEMLEISKGHAYKLIRKMNEELKEQGYITVSGKISAQYLQERCYDMDM